MSSSESNSEAVLELAEEFVDRCRKGERPSLKEYIDRYPALAAEIRDVFPAMAMMENIAVADESLDRGPELEPEKPAARSLEQLGDYRIIREIGRGGMGIVYEAEQVSLGRHVALKVLPNQALQDVKQKRRFQREARAAAKLHHTNIVPVFGVGEHDGLPYYVMQYIQGLGLDAVLDELNHIQPGGSATRTDDEIRLSSRGATAAQMARSLMSGAFPHADESIEDEERTADADTWGLSAPSVEKEAGRPDGENATLATGPLATDKPRSGQHSDSFNLSASSLSLPGTTSPAAGRKTVARKQTYWHSVANIGRQVADALDYAHQQGVLHRDVKPSNLLLDMRGTVWVTDFGLAKVAGPGADNLTHTGDILGTLRYMPAEAFDGKSDAKSDVYSLGLTLYELLAMRPAFDEKDRNKLIKQVTSGEPAPLDRVNREIPRDLVTIVQKTIEKEPERRYSTAVELAADLQRYMDDEPILARRQTELERCVRWARHNRGIAALAAVLTAVLVTATIASSIMAARMARTAEDERSARHQAEESQKREAGERERAEQAKKIAETSFADAREAERIARAAEETGRKLLYTTDMQLAPFVWRDDRTTADQLRVLLAKHIPEAGMKDESGGMKEEGGTRKGESQGSGSSFILHPSSFRSDLRGFEWHYYQHLLEQSSAVFSGHDGPVVDGAFTADGQLVTLDQNAQLRRWDLNSQVEDVASRRDLPDGNAAQVRVLSPNGRLAALARGNKIHVFDASNGDETCQIDSANSPSRHMIFSKDGDKLIIVDDKIRWCDALGGEVIASLAQKFGRIESLALSAEGLTLAVVGHANLGILSSVFRLDMTTKTVTRLAKDIGLGGTHAASALSPDGRLVAVGFRFAGAVRVHETASGRLIAQHASAHASPIAAMAFSGDGTKLATADAEGTIKVWASPQKLSSRTTALSTLKGHREQIHSVGFSLDNKRLITTSADKTARVWDLENAGAAIRSLEGPSQDWSLVARFSPNGQLIAAASGRSVRLWDAATGRLVRKLPGDRKGYISSVAFSPTDHRMLAVGYGGGTDLSYVALWDIDTGTELGRLPGVTDLPNFPVTTDNGVVSALRFSPDGKYLVAGFGSQNLLMQQRTATPLKLWEVATRRLLRRLTGHMNFCVSIDFSRDGKLLASGSRDGTAILWSTATWTATRTLQNPDKDSELGRAASEGMIQDVALSPDGKTLAMASRGAKVWLWDVDGGKLLDALKGHSSAVTAVAFSPDGRTLASGSIDQTVRLWNVETRRELMQLDPGSVELGQISSLAFSPDGQQLLAGGNPTAFWSAAPIVWNDTGRAVEKLQLLLKSDADFPSRIRMLSENLRLHEALAKLDTTDRRVQAALAATQANWHASRKAWPEAVAAFDRLLAVDPTGPDTWLRTPALLRLATALLHLGRPAAAATLLRGGASRRNQDALPAVDNVSVGFRYSAEDDAVRVTELMPGFAGPRAGLVPGDMIEKVNDTQLTAESVPRIGELLAGEAGTKVRLAVRHFGSEKAKAIELTRERFVDDRATGELLYPLRAEVNERLAKQPRDAGLLELRAELAGQWSDAKAQEADFTAAIAALSQQKLATHAADLQRLYRRRGDAYLAANQWQQAVDDFERSVTAETTDESMLANQALARANAWLERDSAAVWTVLKPVEATSERGATLSILPDNSILASGESARHDRYRLVLAVPKDSDLLALRLEALAHPSLPGNGPGRGQGGMFNQDIWYVTATSADGTAKTQVRFQKVWVDDDNHEYPINLTGHWDIWNDGRGPGIERVAVWALTEPVHLTAGMRLLIEMQSHDSDKLDNLGRFRIALSGNPHAIEKEAQQLSLRERPTIAAPWSRLALSYRLQGDQNAIDRLVERRPKLAGPIGDLFTQGREEDRDWRRATALYSKGITDRTSGFDLLSKRARAHEALRNWDSAAADWSRAATGNPEGAKLLAESARRLAAANQFALARASFDKAQALYEQSLQADPESDVFAADLAQLLLDKAAASKEDWVVLKPVEPKTGNGTKLTLQDDGSILVEARPDTVQQTVRWRPGPKPAAALRIETSTHESRPADGAPFFNEYQLVAASMAVSRPGALRGQFVRLDLPGDNSQFRRWPGDGRGKTINLTELQVFQGDRNIALRKKAQQSSSIDTSTPAENAVDGKTSEGQAHTWFTLDGNNPWWEVDLGSEQAIDRIVIWNRPDADLYARMNHYRVRVLDHSRQVVFEKVVEKAPSPSTEIVRPVLLADTTSAPKREDETLTLRLPANPHNGASARFRVSASTRLANLSLEEIALETLKSANVSLRLAGAYAANGLNDQALRYFTKALQHAAGFEARKSVLELAARFDQIHSTLIKGEPEDPQLQLALARKIAERGKQLLAEKQPAQAQVELEKSREMIARLRARSRWSVIIPTEMKSEIGAKMELQKDGSVFVHQSEPARHDTYTLVFTFPMKGIKGLRLEALADSRLPNGGPGLKAEYGNFVLSELTLRVAPGGSPDQQRPIALRDASADFSELGLDVGNAIDGDEDTGWAINPELNRDHTVLFDLAEDVGDGQGSRLTVRLRHRGPEPGFNLGRFRVSLTNDARTLQATRIRLDLHDSEVASLHVALGTAHAQQGHTSEAVVSFTEAVSLTADRAGKARIIAKAAPLEGVLANLAGRAENDGRFQAELARYFAEHGNAQLADAARTKARKAFEEGLAKEPEDSLVITELADLLLMNAPSWTVLKPTEMKSEGGATLTPLEDGSILPDGKHPDRDDYTITAPAGMKNIGAIALDLLPDESFEGNVGRGKHGLAIITELEIFSLDDSGSRRPVALADAAADFEQMEAWGVYSARNVINGNSEDLGWAIAPKMNTPHRLIVKPAQPIPASTKALAFIIRQHHFNKDHPFGLLVGRFRLSVAAEATAYDEEKRRLDAMNLTGPRLRLAAAYALFGNNEEALLHFSKAFERANGFRARKSIIDLAARFEKALPLLIQRKLDDPQMQVALAQRLMERGQQLLAEKQPAQAQADLEKSRDLIMRLRGESRWSVLIPTEMKSAVGAKMDLQKDGSIFVHQSEPARYDTYTLVFPSQMRGIKGLRLEALADSRLPNGGPGLKAGYGNFVLSDLTLRTAPAGRPDQQRPIALQNPSADFSEVNLDVGNAIDRDSDTGWAINPELNKDHTAIFELAEDAGHAQGSRLTVRLRHRGPDPGYNLGRFRVSVTNDAQALQATRMRLALHDSEVADLCLTLGKAHAQQGHTSEAVASFIEAISLNADRAALSRIIAEAAPLGDVLARLAELASRDGPFQAELARHFGENGNRQLADEARTRAQQLFEQKLAQEPENSRCASQLADLLLLATEAKPAIMVPTSENEGVNWCFTTKRPPADWMSEAFDDSAWKTGAGSFGHGLAPGLVARTEWNTSDIWLRRRFEWKPDPAVRTLVSRVIHDDGFELFINGQQVLGRRDLTTGYTFYPVDAKALGLLKAGTNTLAVHCLTAGGAQYIDVGLRGLSSNPRVAEQRLTAMKVTDPWARLAAAYRLVNDEPAVLRLLADRPEAASSLGELFAVDQDWERAVAEYSRAITPRARDAGLFAKRAESYEKLLRWDQAIADWNKVHEFAADKNKAYGDRSCLIHRATLYERLGDHEKALADYNRAVETPNAGLDPLLWRAAYWAQRAQWKKAADDYRHVWAKREKSFYTEWGHSRERALLSLMTGDTDGYRQAVAELLTRTEGLVDVDSSYWLAYILILAPEMITDQNRDRLTAATNPLDGWTKPRMQAALLFRRGDFQGAADLFDQNPGGPSFQFLAAMAHHQLGHPDRARQLFEQADTWIQRQRDHDPGNSAVPRSVNWRDWSIFLTLHHEAARRLAAGQLAERDARLKTDPENAMAWIDRARLLDTFGLKEAAISDLDRVPQSRRGSSDFFGLRGRILAELNRYDEAIVDLNRAVELKSTDPMVFAMRGRIFRDRGLTEPARNEFQRSLDTKPTEQAARLLAGLLLRAKANADVSGWTILAPVDMKAASGAKLELQKDGSVLARQLQPGKNDSYSLVFRSELKGIRGLRLELMADNRLPGAGPGWNPDGGVILNELTLQVAPDERPDQARAIALRNASADFSQLYREVRGAIDGNGSTGWGVEPELGGDHSSVYELAEQVGDGRRMRLIVRLDQGIQYGNYLLGRFRLSATGDPAALDREQQCFSAMNVTDPWAKLGAAYVLTGDAQRAADLLAKSEEGAIASWEESGCLTDAVLDSLKARHPEPYTRLLLRLASVAAARGQVERARTLHERLIKLQP